jgi:inner membrane protein
VDFPSIGRNAETQPPPPLPRAQPPFLRRNSTIVKLLGAGALILMIPLQMITGVLSKRLEWRNEAVADITGVWGKDQQIIGPLLCVPYQCRTKVVKDLPVAARWPRRAT